jgi:hypothetical protein
LKSCSADNGKVTNRFINYLLQKTSLVWELDDYWYQSVGFDSQMDMNIKKECKESFVNYLKLLSNYKINNYINNTHYTARFLMHTMELSSKDNMFYFSTSGHANLLHICSGSSLNRGSQLGLPFFSVAVIKDLEEATDYFGSYKIYKVSNKCYIVIYSWRRLNASQISILVNSKYSILSTSFATYTRSYKSTIAASETERIKYSLVPKLLVSHSVSQRTAEKLMDIRYLFMASISDYSQADKLIKEKLQPPYQNRLLHWIYNQISKKISQYLLLDKEKVFKFKTPVYVEGSKEKREISSIGGECDLPSIWSNWILKDIQDFFDEIFVYVHTLKDPSNLFHESIKAVNTIIEFQNKYNSLNINDQSGIHTIESFKQNILNKINMGCWVDMVYNSSLLMSRKYESNKNSLRLKLMTQLESICELTSTKSCIPDIKRKSEKIEETNKFKEQKEILKEHLGLDYVERDIYKEVLEEDALRDRQTIFNKNSVRYRVHDCILEHLLNHPDHNFTLDVANWNIKYNNCHVRTDICIKAQYGAKREFYVINFGAKAMARIFENTFKFIGQLLPQEMISIPGDKKMLHMQKALDELILTSTDRKQLHHFTNGDCSKWSACETMSSFWALCDGWGLLYSEKHKEFLKTVVSSWGNKEITVPTILTQTIKYNNEKTKYLKTPYMKSTQNFLQGMFNYSSSVKAVCATEFALNVFKKNYPHSKLFCKHLEHSDDYCLLVRTNNIEEFEKFRIYHRLSQRMHGIQDSFKKTNTQRYVMEFISLMSFGGQLSYPHIKKLKEVGMNTSCTGYQADIMSVVSRCSESIRVGTTIEQSYAQQLLHNHCVLEAYSLLPGMRNFTGFNHFNTPINLFGVPDCNPLVYTICKGDPNIYRLWKFGSELSHKMISLLYNIEKDRHFIEKLFTESTLDNLDVLYSPKFVNKVKSKKLRYLISKLPINYEESQKFFQDHPSYSIIKPRNKEMFFKWLSAMYHVRSFQMAYLNLSRAQLNLKVSGFCTRKCIIHDDKLLTINEFMHVFNIKYISKQSINNEIKLSTLTGYDSNIEGYFNIMESADLIENPKSERLCNTINNLPKSYTFIPLTCGLNAVIEQIFEPEYFLLNNYPAVKFSELLVDIKNVKDKINVISIYDNNVNASKIIKYW